MNRHAFDEYIQMANKHWKEAWYQGNANQKQNEMPFIRAAKIKHNTENFPGGIVDSNLPANAADMGSIPGLGRFRLLPHAAEQLSP